MSEDSPPPFITFRSSPEAPVDVYARALELAGHVHHILEAADQTRFHLKDRLDRTATALVVELGRAQADIRPGRWRYYRAALKLATDCTAVLDILDRQDPSREHVTAARATARRLCDELRPLALG